MSNENAWYYLGIILSWADEALKVIFLALIAWNIGFWGCFFTGKFLL